MEQREGEAVGKEIIFRAPVHICKPGEIRQEYEKQKKKMEEEKEKGEKASEEDIHKILENDQRQTGNQRKKTTCHKPVEPGLIPLTKEQEDKKKKHHHQRKEEFGTLKHIQDSVLGVLSDSENEEPIGKRTRHTSAFVRKTRSSSGSGRIVQSHVGRRSRSCTSTEEGRVRNSCLSRTAAVAKTSIAYSSNAGILLSSENSRSFSAPILAPDKRLAWRGVVGSAAPLMPPNSKPERSISPESNDSISEELNHFKPIVCSPCTPPKRLPDGRIVEPVIVKSTPRNLSQSFHKATSYEASPTILHKWKQIEMDRQCTKMTSKGTITSPISEDFIPSQSPGEKKNKLCSRTLEKSVLKDHLTQADTSGQDRGKTLTGNKRRLLFDTSAVESNASANQSAKVHSPTKAQSTRRTCKGTGRVGCALLSGTPSTEEVSHACGKCAGAMRCNRSPANVQDQTNDSNGRDGVNSRPTSRRGRKRRQKTKHLEEAGRVKGPRLQSREDGDMEPDSSCLYAQRLQQEREDRELALKLQRQFNMESQMADRRKTSPDKYPLRSWSSHESRMEHCPRRSVRISQKKQAL
ncbi:E3 ubiquitin-protein ligase RNF169-like isoform X2 [Megalops cyprinoides]|nr:E3 ubiquitin-protein ligase RNF169-like isoform X2 [Megalops cyprinoides]